MASTDTTVDPGREPDVMNDPDFDTNHKGKEKSSDDVDTCRICRGESSKEEPLFYPCKCSGSIKFVHQSCLMEWLSHSQKKHCELCKTPFRFTKLYHPNMPNSVPLPIFLRQAAVHTWRTFLTWSRFHLVLFVWVAWLPWCMRIVWRALFWIGDGGWINWQKLQEQATSGAQEHMETVLGKKAGSTTTELPMSKDALASAVVSRVANALPNFLTSSSQVLNLTDRDPILIKFARKLMVGVIARTSSQSVQFLPASSVNATGIPTVAVRSSWLSNFSFLKFLTPFPTFNNLVIDTLEGQLITLLVVISFILIFLIREWVVQQQPGVNIGAGPNVNPPAGPGGEVPIFERIARQRAEQRVQPVHDGQAVAEGEARVELPPLEAREPGTPARPAPGREEPHNLNEERPVEAQQDSPELLTPELHTNLATSSDAQHVESHNHETEPTPRTSSTAGQAASTQRPSMPKRNSTARAAEIRRTLEEQSRASDRSDWSDHKVFLDLWGRAKKNPREVLKIIEQEGRGEELNWIVAALSKVDHALGADMDQSDDNQRDELGTQADATSNIADYGIDDGAGPSVRLETHPSEPTWSRFDVLGLEGERPGGDFIASEMGQAYSENGIEGLEPEALSSIANRGDHDLGPAEMSPRSGINTNPDSQSSRMKISVSPDRSPVPEGPSALETSPPVRRHEDNSFNPEYEGTNESDGNAVEGAGSSSNTSSSASETDSHAGEEFGGPADQDGLVTQVHLADDQNGLGRNQTLGETIMNWLWGDINPHAHLLVGNLDPQGGDDERIVDDLANEAPFVPVEDGHPIINEINDAEDPEAIPVQDPEVEAAAAQAGLDPAGLDQNGAEAVEDVEDLEGIMELVGMQGPLAALIQNGMFCAILVSMTIFLGVWIPYIAGKLFLVFLANPISLLLKLPLRWASTSADLIIDVGVFSAGCSFYWVDTIVRLLCAPVGWLIPPIARLSQNNILAETAKRYAESAMERLAKTFVATGGSLSETDIPIFSIIAHESLKTIEYYMSQLLQTVGQFFIGLIHFFAARDLGYRVWCRSLTTNAIDSAKTLSNSTVVNISEGAVWISSLFKINLLRVSFNIPQRTTPLDYSMAYWNTKDRIIAIIFGYVFFSLLGFLYIKVRASFRGRGGNGKVDGAVADVLYQAGGVLKVVLIISIEMIVFPLYCGLLLDIALLPLFGNVTALSRVDFLLASPNTSLFVHWFIGTCYMFHFALFVSMCRKIMRSGVLCKLTDSFSPFPLFVLKFWSEPALT